MNKLMRQTRFLTAFGLICFGLIFAPICRGEDRGASPKYVERVIGPASLRMVGNVPVMTLSGTPEEIGQQQAALIQEVSGPLLGFPKQFLKTFGGGAFWPVIAEAGRRLVSNAPERYQAEIQALAKAGPYDPENLRVANGLVEIRRLGGCAAFLIPAERSATKGPLFGRNFDFPPFGVLNQYGCVMIYRPKGQHAFVSIGFPGLIGVLSGMNDAGLCVATLDVYSSGDNSKKFDLNGVPLALTFRQILEECETVAEAEALLRKVPRTTYMNLAACDSQNGAVFEITPKSVGVRPLTDMCLTCTNHFRTDDLKVSLRCDRFSRLCKIDQDALDSRKIFDVEDVQAAMHAVNQGGLTIQTMVFEPATRKLHVVMGDGPVSNRPMTEIDAKLLFK